MRAKLPYLIADRDRHGVMRYYVRRHGRKIRIREQPGTEAFALAYAEAMASFDTGAAEQRNTIKLASAGTLGWLAARYFGSAEFRRLILMAMQGSRATQVHESLKHAEPVRLPSLRVNGTYLEGIPLQSTPPSLLLNLPQLPPEVEYRVAGSDLVLRDVDANLVVDLIHSVIP